MQNQKINFAVHFTPRLEEYEELDIFFIRRIWNVGWAHFYRSQSKGSSLVFSLKVVTSYFVSSLKIFSLLPCNILVISTCAGPKVPFKASWDEYTVGFRLADMLLNE